MFGLFRRRRRSNGIGLGNLLGLMAVPLPQQPKEWEQPENYEQELYWQGFIVPSMYEGADLTKYPTIIADLDILERYLLPLFWQFNQKAKYYQSRYYYYQRIFLVGALLTTIISVVNSFVYTLDISWQPVVIFNIPIDIQPGNVNFFLGIFTMIISARTSYYTLLANYGEPLQRWSKYRRLTEELRITYFKYLAHIGEFQGPNRVKALRTQVLSLRKQEQQDG